MGTKLIIRFVDEDTDRVKKEVEYKGSMNNISIFLNEVERMVAGMERVVVQEWKVPGATHLNYSLHKDQTAAMVFKQSKLNPIFAKAHGLAYQVWVEQAVLEEVSKASASYGIFLDYQKFQKIKSEGYL